MLLTSEEKRRFIEWLDMEVLSNTALLEAGAAFIPAVLADQFKREREAAMTIAAKLRSMEEQTITNNKEN